MPHFLPLTLRHEGKSFSRYTNGCRFEVDELQLPARWSGGLGTVS